MTSDDFERELERRLGDLPVPGTLEKRVVGATLAAVEMRKWRRRRRVMVTALGLLMLLWLSKRRGL